MVFCSGNRSAGWVHEVKKKKGRQKDGQKDEGRKVFIYQRYI